MKILFITLSNVGDAILTLPVLDCLKEYFPHAHITVMSGPRPKELFEKNPYISRLIVYDKYAKLREKTKLFYKLAKQNFDIVVDLRNTFYGAFLPAKYKISPFFSVPEDIGHMSGRHLYKIKELLAKMKVERPFEAAETTLFVNPEDKEYIRQVLAQADIKTSDRLIIVSAGARSDLKRWDKEKFTQLVSYLTKDLGSKVVLIGDKQDQPVTSFIAGHSQFPVVDLAGKTSLTQLAYLLKTAGLLITNDSACLHMASYINMPVVGIFGPTSEKKYGPWSDNFRVAKVDIFCRPCEKAQCKYKTLNCLKKISVEDVLTQVKDILAVR